MRVPIACTLTAEEAGDRMEEWKGLFAGSVEVVERTSAQQLRVRLASSTRLLEAAADLAQREKACCSFFDFSIEPETDAFWLNIRVPPEASVALDGFALLVSASN